MNLITSISPPRRWSAVIMALSFWLQWVPAWATPIFEPVCGFEISPTNPQASLIQASDGNFYGTTTKGGCFGDAYGIGYGTVFKMTPGGTLTTLVNFDFTKGRSPEAPLVQGSDGNFYGTTSRGGSSDSGTVFKMTASGTLTTLVNFTLLDGGRPTAALVQGGDGNFYGTTTQGGSGGNGTVFKVTPEGTLTTLVNFNNGNGSSPEAALVLSDGNFYGTTARGGSSNSGTVFKTTSSGTLTTLVHFTGMNGSWPTAALVQGGDGNLYGTTTRGGSYSDLSGNGYGTVFKMTPGGTLTTLVNFAEVNGSFPSGSMVQGGDGNFYGMTTKGGSYSDFNGNTYGTVFTMTPGGNPTTLVNFTGANGFWPTTTALVKASDGSFYGTTAQGGNSGYGTVFKMNSTGSLTTLVHFTAATRSYPNTLLQGTDGNLYGTTRSGGIHSNNSGSSYGTVFKVTSTGTLTTMANFNSTNGSFPGAALAQDSDGSIFGTTQQGGSSGDGTVFKMTQDGNLTTLVNFTGINGRLPTATLVKGNDGNFYGSTSNGGSNGRGTVFMMTPTGTLTTLVNFTGANGGNPFAALVRGSDGNFYGTSGSGGSGGGGTVFMMTPTGTLTTLVNFTGDNGGSPKAALVQGSDGNFYGTTGSGGSSGGGTVFKMTATGILTTLVNFAGGNGFSPAAALVQGSDGNFYGTTKEGGSSGTGTVFKVTPGGAINTLKNFTGGNGSYPTAALVRGSDGNLYGTTDDGGSTSDSRPAGGGQIYRLRMGPSVLSQAQTNVTPSSATLKGTVNPGGYATSVSFHYGTDSTLATFSTAAAGSLPVGTANRSVQAAISGLQSGSTYYFRVVASNAENTLPQLGSILSFTTQGAQSAYSIWAAIQFSSGQLANPLVSGTGADPDNDGVVNLLECSFNLNPLISGNPILIADTGTSGLPLIRRTESPATFSIQYLRRKASTSPNLTYTPQFSSGLDGTWSAFTGMETVQSIDATWERVTAEESPSNQEKRFGRVKVFYGE